MMVSGGAGNINSLDSSVESGDKEKSGSGGGEQQQEVITWQERAQRSAAQASPATTGSDSSVNNRERPPMLELSQLRLKLEEKRREIERKNQQQDMLPSSQSPEEQRSEPSVPVQQVSHRPAPSSAAPQAAKIPVQQPSAPSMPHQAFPAHVPETADALSQSPPPEPRPSVPSPPPHGGHTDSWEEDASTDGFLVSFGEGTPQRPKPQLGTARDSGSKKDAVSDSDREGSEGAVRLQGKITAVVAADSDSGSSSSGSYHSLPGGSGEEGVVEVVRVARQKAIQKSEMERKRQRLMQQQQKRQEELERKRLQKEMEAQRRQQEKELKEEEQEKKKAEEKARREAIFQQYIQRKLEQEEEKAPSSAVSQRDHSAPEFIPAARQVEAQHRDEGEQPENLPEENEMNRNKIESPENDGADSVVSDGSEGDQTRNDSDDDNVIVEDGQVGNNTDTARNAGTDIKEDFG